MLGSIGSQVLKPRTAPEGPSPARERLKNLLLFRVERKVASQRGTPTPLPADEHTFAEAAIETTLSKKERGEKASVLVENLTHQLIARSKPSTPIPGAFKSKKEDPSSATLPPRPFPFAGTPLLPPVPGTPTPSCVGSRRSSNKGDLSFTNPSPQMQSLRRGASTPEPYQRLKVCPTPHVPIELEEPQVDLWASLARQAAREQANDELRARLARAEKMRQQREILDEQTALRQRRKDDNRKERAWEQKMIEDDAKLWHEENQNRREKRREVAIRIRDDREDQVHHREHQRHEQEEQRKAQEAAILERIRVELEGERKRQEMIKEREKRFKEELIAANEIQKGIKKKIQQEEQAMEEEYIRLANERAEQEERRRKAAWDEMKNKMEHKEQIAFELQETLDAKAAQDEEKALQVTAEVERKAVEKQQAEIEKRRQVSKLIKQYQIEQIIQRAEAAQVEVEQSKQQSKKDVEEAIAKDTESIRRDRNRARQMILEQKANLREQIARHSKRQTVLMTEEEQKLNRQILVRSGALS